MLLPWTKISLQGPQAGVPQQPQGKPDLAPVAFLSVIRVHKRSSTTWAASNEFPFGSSLSDLPALRCRSWLHQQKGSCRFGKFPSNQQRLKLRAWFSVITWQLEGRYKTVLKETPFSESGLAWPGLQERCLLVPAAPRVGPCPSIHREGLPRQTGTPALPLLGPTNTKHSLKPPSACLHAGPEKLTIRAFF